MRAGSKVGTSVHAHCIILQLHLAARFMTEPEEQASDQHVAHSASNLGRGPAEDKAERAKAAGNQAFKAGVSAGTHCLPFRPSITRAPGVPH